MYLKAEEEFVKKGRSSTVHLKAEEEFIEKGRSPTAYLKTEVKGWKG